LEGIVEKSLPSEDGEAVRKNVRNPALKSERSWFAVYTTCRHEKRVARHMEQRQIEHFLPLYRTEHRWKDGTQALVDLPLFPGYVFARIELHHRVSVLEVPGVVSILGTESRPTPLPEFEVEILRAGLRPNVAEPHPLLTVGQRVRIKAGALAGVEGIVIRKKSGIRVVLTLSLLMQSIAIEVDSDDVELVHTSSAPMRKVTDKTIELPQCMQMSEFECLDSGPESSQVHFPATSPVRR
jgi:transcription antitermination factor NusG